MKEPFGCCGMYGSGPPCAPPEAAWIPFRAPLADGVVLLAPLVGAGDPCACACVVWAGEFCDENFELILVIHELRRELLFPSGGVVPDLSVLLRLSRAGRFGGAFKGKDGVAIAVAVTASAGGVRGSGGDDAGWLGRGVVGMGAGAGSWCC